MQIRPAGTRSAGFWLIILAATANYTVLSASAPLVISIIDVRITGW